MHQSPLTTKRVLTSKDISDHGSSQHDDNNNLRINEVLHSASRDFATELMTVDKAQSSIISDQNTGFLVGAPNALALSSQHKLCSKPILEIQANKVAKKIKRAYKIWVSHKTYIMIPM